MVSRIAAAFALALALALAIAQPALAATPVNVNKADAATIAEALDGIGQSKAEAIVAYRDAHGPFKSVEELAQVKGIGQATLERNRAAILFTGGGKAGDGAAAAAKGKAGKKARPAAAE
ncbi:competence protein ComEA [Frateuria sp. Soil773]|uniref:ComEA family DNA-binding protein n=1 Tax=Frateuria sp. Soil773 TaxID=1736407 RepID=UPI0006FB0C7D|nr:ComEA family DNA-binding protein [Frateuria sp. Soil773]KRE88408.1 competence protein ComEA [Frateuria sp. Soil773]